jgi:endonuclease/exonuclease/phosphatase family metal-dependent hydrolase
MRGACRRAARLAMLAAAALAFMPVANAAASGVALGVATWNLAWLIDADTHARWVAACSRNGWPDDPRALPAAERATLADLPPCATHNGMAFPPGRCQSRRDGWPNAARYPDAHPCRDTADLATWPRYAEKLARLQAEFRRLDAAGVGLVAVQEVSSAAAVRAILPPGWSVTTTREFPGTPKIVQHVGIAWKSGVAVRDIAPVNALADSGVPGQPLRPGLAFTVDVGNQPVRALVVHLKAGCRSRDLDDPGPVAGRASPAASDCATLRYQLPALEAWIDANAARDFALLGDFNRTLGREPAADSATSRTRIDGGSPATPVGPCVMRNEGGRRAVTCPARTRAFFPELNDGDPPGAVLWRARPATRGDRCRLPGPHGELAQDGIDHILIGAALKRRLTASALNLRIESYRDRNGAPWRATPDQALPSDHCPHVVTWTPRR